MSLRSASRGGPVLLSLAFLLSACGGAPDSDSETELVARAKEAIKGGMDDPNDKAVVGVAINFGDGSGEICTGSLIAPNLVLTAHHCVSPVFGEDQGGVSCTKTYFGETYPPRDFSVTTADMISPTLTGSHDVQDIILPPGDDPEKLCGFDQAILILADSVDPAEAVPLVPRVDSPLVKGEQYSAIGFGGTDDNGTGAGQRRRRDNLFVSCVAGACPVQTVKATEFVGDTGICHGDSGGPSIDLMNRVVGVTSRGGSGCSNPVYGYVYGWAQWIKDATAMGALVGGSAPPPWANGWPTDPAYSMPIGATCKHATDCASGHCVGDYCTRLCNDASPCPTGYSCEGTDPDAVCTELPPPKETPKQAPAPPTSTQASGSGCALRSTSPDPSKPVPWIVVAAAMAALSIARPRKRRRF